MAGTIKMFCIRMNILSHRNNIVLFLACNMAAMQGHAKPLYQKERTVKLWCVSVRMGGGGGMVVAGAH